MSRRRKNARPKPIVLDPFTARVVRGPHKEDPAKWYWRITEQRFSAGCLWATRAEITKELAHRVAGVEEEPDTPLTFGELAHIWLSQQKGRERLAPKTVSAWDASVRRLCQIGRDWPLAEVKHNFHKFRDESNWRKSTLTVNIRIARRIMKFGELRDWCPPFYPILRCAAQSRRDARQPPS